MSAEPAFDERQNPADHALLIDRLAQLFREVLHVNVSTPQTDLIESGLLDSLALVELLFEIEQRFGVDLALEELDLESFRTLERLAAVIAGRTGTVRS